MSPSARRCAFLTTCYNVVPKLDESLSKALCIFDHLSLINFKLFTLSLLHRNGNTSNGMVVGSSLKSREDGQVDLVLNVIHHLVALAVYTPHPPPVEDQPCPGSSQGLVNRGGDNITVEERGGGNSSSNQTRHMSHVCEQPRALLVCYGPEPGIVEGPGVATDTGHNHLGLDLVGHRLKEDRGSRDFCLVGIKSV